MDEQTLEAWFLEHDDPHFEIIVEAKTSEQALDIAENALHAAGFPASVYKSPDLQRVVNKIRRGAI